MAEFSNVSRPNPNHNRKAVAEPSNVSWSTELNEDDDDDEVLNSIMSPDEVAAKTKVIAQLQTGREGEREQMPRERGGELKGEHTELAMSVFLPLRTPHEKHGGQDGETKVVVDASGVDGAEPGLSQGTGRTRETDCPRESQTNASSGVCENEHSL